MKTLFVYDGRCAPGRLAAAAAAGDDAVLFPLTSRTPPTEELSGALRERGASPRVLDAADLVNASAERVRTGHVKFIADLPGRVAEDGRGLRDLFAVDAHASAWWFGLPAEKSPYKSDAINLLIQLDAVVGAARREKAGGIAYGCASPKLRNALREYTRAAGLRFTAVPARLPEGLRERLRDHQGFFALKHLANGARRALSIFFFRRELKGALGQRAAPAGPPPDISIVTFYPLLDRAAAEKGQFKNRYYGPLQEALEKSGRTISWTAIYAPSNLVPKSEALAFARRFIEGGCRLRFLEEDGSWRLQARAFLRLLRNGLRFLRLQKRIRAAHDLDGYNFYTLFKDDWYSSFLGATAYEGVHYYGLFRAMLARDPGARILYPCEMHAWEKALIAARDARRPATNLFAYQSGTVSPMLLNYFNDPSETADGGGPLPFPRPDKLICNGDAPRREMAGCGWPASRLAVAEAVRYGSLKEELKGRRGEKKDVVMLAFSIDPHEAAVMLSMALEAFPAGGPEVWIKPHPFIHMDRVLERAGLPPGAPPFPVKYGPVEDFLPAARVVVVGESSVCLQALAYGCEVVSLDSPEWFNMSPLRRLKTPAGRSANSPAALRRAVDGILSAPRDPEEMAAEARAVINDFFLLEDEGAAPRRFMECLGLGAR